MLRGPRLDHLRGAEDEDVPEPPPVFPIRVHDEGDVRIRGDVADPFEAPRRGALWLFVDGRVQPAAGHGEADRNDVRAAAAIGGGEPRDTRAPKDGAVRRYVGSSHRSTSVMSAV